MRHFLRDDDLSPAEQSIVLDAAAAMVDAPHRDRPLDGPRSVAVIFEKPSLRTRVSFEVAIADLGGNAVVVDAQGTHFGRGETIEDAGRVLSGYVDAIVIRTFDDQRVAALAHAATVPVINALTDGYHPCQLLADLLTIRQLFGSTQGRTLAYVGDAAFNMANSYALAGAAAGMHVRIGAPAGYQPDPALVARARAIASSTGGWVTVTDDPFDAVAGADVVATDTWTSMGQDESADRVAMLMPYQLNAASSGRGQAGCGRVALPAGAPRGGDHRRGDGRPAERGVPTSGQPAAGAEGGAGLALAPGAGGGARAQCRRPSERGEAHARRIRRFARRECGMTAPTTTASKAARHARIVALIRGRSVRAQTDLAELLAADGIQITQATLSRDLDELGAVKVRTGDGTSAYVIPEDGNAALRPAEATPGASATPAARTADRSRRERQPRGAADATGRRAVPGQCAGPLRPGRRRRHHRRRRHDPGRRPRQHAGGQYGRGDARRQVRRLVGGAGR